MTLRHNKRKNSCIVYEQLLTLAARLASQKKVNEFEYIVELTKKHYNPSTALGKERRALHNLIEAQCSSPADADAIIQESLNELKTISNATVEMQKVALINEINSYIGPELFKVPIKNYKLYASAQILANEERSGYKHTFADERVKIKKVLRENINRKVVEKEEIEIDAVTYKVLINKFNQKYGPFINEDQKNILSSWIKYLITEDKSVIEPVITEKIERIHSIVKSSLKNKNHKGAEYYELLKEADETLDQKKGAEINEDLVYEVMRYFDLVTDLEGDE